MPLTRHQKESPSVTWEVTSTPKIEDFGGGNDGTAKIFEPKKLAFDDCILRHMCVVYIHGLRERMKLF
ncbi:Uncharacterised protein [Escherichia coli]|nr:Uncharacterised protein [Escherichia coli]CAD6113904.1 Uncharacterised protein [Escherichia coli]CAD6182364.1 Uncharacterised protein [Escherichia coli]